MAAFHSNNLHYAFYVEYYKDIKEQIQEIKFPDEMNKISFQDKNQRLLNKINHVSNEIKSNNNIVPLDNIDTTLTTLDFEIIYPGVLIGTGITHKCGAKEEIALGFTFDYVTGIPYLPGSSVKGILRDAFQYKEYIHEILETRNIMISNEEIIQLELLIFEGFTEEEIIPVSQRIIFYDAVLNGNIEKKKGNILGLDIIAPHRKNKDLLELVEPEPITFLKILPGNFLHFIFRLEDIILPSSLILDKEDLKTLFQTILQDVGIGAKTNVGYGVLNMNKKAISSRKQD